MTDEKPSGSHDARTFFDLLCIHHLVEAVPCRINGAYALVGHAHGRVLGHRLPTTLPIGDRVLIAHVAHIYADIGAVAAERSNIRVEEYDFAEIS